jgi:shikimate kinase
MSENLKDPDLRSNAPLWFLVGYRGSGKTTVARLLARQLGWSWLDADEVLESRYSSSIRATFASEGEAAFREKESAILVELCKLDRHVIATGGGVVLRPENCQRLRDAGRIIWLKGDPHTLWLRMQQDANTLERRPPLSQGGLAEIEELLKIREPLYASCADLTVDTTTRSPEEIAGLILATDHGLRTKDV